MNEPQKRPLTQRELRAAKKNRDNVDYVLIINKSKKQSIPIQLKTPPGVDWFVGEQAAMLYPQKMAKFPQNRLYSEQIANLQKQGRIQVLKSSR